MRVLTTVAFIVALSLPLSVYAQGTEPQPASPDQQSDQEEVAPYGTGAGLELMFTNGGFGLGGYGHWAVSPKTSIFSELAISSAKDPREFKLVNIFGQSFVPGKANYVLVIPLRVGLHRRLFKDQIMNNFRPFVQVMSGPSAAMQWPYFKDNNDNGLFDPTSDRKYGAFESLFKASFRYGFGGHVAIGAFWGSSRQTAQGIRIGYSFNYFLEEVRFLEQGENATKQYLGTPTISLVFGRLW